MAKKNETKNVTSSVKAKHISKEIVQSTIDDYANGLEDDVALESMDDQYEQLQNEFEQVRKCLGMYISYTETLAAMHLFSEIFHNAADEFSNGKVPFDTIVVEFDERNQTFLIRDGGRGIPLSKLKDVCMKKHISTKYERSEIMKRYAGRNGVGMKVTVALTDVFNITSNRNSVTQTIVFTDGIPEVKPVTENKKPVHGLEVSFKPSEKYLGKLFVSLDLIEDYLRRMSYLIPEGLYIKYKGIDISGKERKITYTTQGVDTAVKHLSVNLEFPPVPITIETQDFDIDFAFSYDNTIDGNLMESYCNYVHTKEGGTHETALVKALCEFFVKEAKNLDPNSKYEVTYDDCRKGLVSVVAGWHYDPGFEGQHKSKVNNADFVSVGKDCIKLALADYFKKNNGLLRRIIGILRKNVQARLETIKIKAPKSVKAKNALDFMGIAGFEDITDPNYTTAAELLIAEGVSAVGAIKNVRNRKFQAVFGVMGVVNNVDGCSLAQVMAMPVYFNLVKVLGCGIGPTFNIQNLRFKKIIIMTDSDVDGSNIASLVLSFIWKFLPELILGGYVYRGESPLYRIDTYPIRKHYKGNAWLYSKKELYGVFNTIVANNIIMGLETKKGQFVELTKNQVKEFLEINTEYLMEYNMLVSRTSGHEIVLEYAAYYRYIYGKNADKFKKAIEKQFPEVTYNILDQSLTGSYEGESISLLVDDIFDGIAKRIFNIYGQNDFFEFYYKNKNDDSPFTKTTIGQFLRSLRSSYNIKTLQRYKGLGEVEEELLFQTSINPKLRKLVRYTVSDAKKVDEMFELYHGKKKDNREARRGIAANSDISYADIDN